MSDDLFARPDGRPGPPQPASSGPSPREGAGSHDAGATSPSPVPPPPSPPGGNPPPPPPSGTQDPRLTSTTTGGFASDTYYAPGWQPAPPRTEPLAVASVPAGALLGPVGVGLGGAALSRVRANGTRGRGLAVAGIVTGGVVTVAWALGGIAWWQGEQARAPLAGDVAAPATVHSRQLVLGSCLAELPPDGEVGRVRVVPCADEHRAQVVARTDFGADEVWTGQDDADRRVARVCGPEALGPDAPEGVELVVWAPTAASWDDGDRTGLCLAASDDPLPADLLG